MFDPSTSTACARRSRARRATAIVLGLLLVASSAAADDPALMCFGNEPSWGLALERPGEARLDLPDVSPVTFRGTVTMLPATGERVWRGRAEAGSGDLVAFLHDAPCSDGMSDVRHPVTVRVALPDGRALAGCCRILGGAMAATKGRDEDAASAASIEGSTWRLTALPGHDAAFLAAVPDGVTVRLTAGTVRASAGCNRMSGGYTVDGDRITFGPLAGTMMACPPPIGDVEAAVARALSGTRRIAVDGDALTLIADDGSALTFSKEPAARLDGTWTVTGFNNGRQAVVSPLTDTVLTLSFRDGRVSGHAGCNTFRASYTVEGDRLAIGRAATTRKACPGEGVMEQERQYVAALESVTTWAIERDVLDLHRGDGERALMAKRGDPASGS